MENKRSGVHNVLIIPDNWAETQERKPKTYHHGSNSLAEFNSKCSKELYVHTSAFSTQAARSNLQEYKVNKPQEILHRRTKTISLDLTKTKFLLKQKYQKTITKGRMSPNVAMKLCHAAGLPKNSLGSSPYRGRRCSKPQIMSAAS